MAIAAFKSTDVYLAASNRRIIVFIWQPATNSLETLDNLCIFPKDPLVDMCLRHDSVFCLAERSLAVVKLVDSSATNQSTNHTPVAGIDAGGRRVTTPISKSHLKRQTFELPASSPSFKDLKVIPGTSERHRRLSLPFDCGRLRRICYDDRNDRILVGGEVLNVLVRSDGRFRLDEGLRVHSSYFAAMPTTSGVIYLNDSVSNDLIVLDSRLNEINRFKGLPDHEAVQAENGKVVQQTAGCLLWLAGPAKVVRINYDSSMEDVGLFDAGFIEQFEPTIFVVQASPDDGYYMAADLRQRGPAVVVCSKTDTHVVPITNVGGQSSHTLPSEMDRFSLVRLRDWPCPCRRLESRRPEIQERRGGSLRSGDRAAGKIEGDARVGIFQPFSDGH